jgi:phage baseplate assembly protein W
MPTPYDHIIFKHVGTKFADETRTNNVIKTTVPINIKMPLELGLNGGLKTNTQIADGIRDNFKNLLQTNYGDLPIRYNYGANLLPLISEFSSKENFDAEAAKRIIAATQRWMPIIDIKGYATEIIPDRNTQLIKVSLYVEYDVPKAEIFSEKISVLLTIM